MEQAAAHAPDEWKELISSLPSVINAEFVLDESGSIIELHVLSSTDRGAKQIVRDIQSAMMARFGVELDHRVISIAQIPFSPDCSSAVKSGDRVVCSGMDISTRGASCKISVELLYHGECYVGRAARGATSIERRRAAAEATLDAISQCAGSDDCRLRLSEVRSTAIAGSEAILSMVSVAHDGHDELLICSCISRDDEPLTAVRATLDALNRRLALALQ